MSDLWFFDTNVLLYMYDGSNEVKRQASIALFRRSIDATRLRSVLRWCRSFTSRLPESYALSRDCPYHHREPL